MNNNTSLIWNAILTVAVLVLFFLHFSGSKPSYSLSNADATGVQGRRIVYVQVAASYTHLDVYKRQVVILVMHGKLLQAFTHEFSRATSADPWIDLQRLLTIAGFARLTIANRVGDDLIEAGIRWLADWHCR